MAKRKRPLWLRRSADQVVAQWTARRAGTQWAVDERRRDWLIRHLCLELLWAISRRIPDTRIAQGIVDLLTEEHD